MWKHTAHKILLGRSQTSKGTAKVLEGKREKAKYVLGEARTHDLWIAHSESASYYETNALTN